mmetsp:Transcript_3242/g.4489  ORF Transcript_3242/g.4489 Transcript_3242/m.4489 type:complete len:282 (+) Transcript_3242:88-933(+)|eukprot:CAMPEP_0197292994 /NCGR_PEP_ID=MMETSP0890-20130614/26265_1 /TAXON_ID=44058 ORGANISM="Aureoumbra lagunensis, Strain CCMP1510" /NCGR_SAMPLE_ID=MMETSP0890 /ASSEMBLY_ACC=CAM_ASM_000533 /LENGTH=281 /DNA_ID=CAMNT_0042767371 /DNA_START=82 /DNA_END=927 /DNA_ORIENTATION=-
MMSNKVSELYAPLDISDQIVLITGASSGFGAAAAWRFAEIGCKLILIARREERLKELAAEICTKYPRVKIHCEPLDMCDLDKVEALPSTLPEEFAQVDILVNNAGIARGKHAAQENTRIDIEAVMKTNVTSLIVATSVFSKGMLQRGRGHIINIGSIAGHEAYAGGSVYCATKHAVTAFTTAARHDLVGTPIRVTCISPGFAETEFSIVRFNNDLQKAASVYANLVPLNANDIADQIIYAATRPAHVQIADIISWPTNQASATSIARVGPTLGVIASSSST